MTCQALILEAVSRAGDGHRGVALGAVAVEGVPRDLVVLKGCEDLEGGAATVEAHVAGDSARRDVHARIITDQEVENPLARASRSAVFLATQGSQRV